MNHFKLYIILIATLFFFIRASAELDGSSKEALDNTQATLTNPAQRAEAMKNDQKIQALDSQVEASVGKGQNKEAVYKISSDVLANMANKANGEGVTMQEMIERAQKNPEAFYNEMFSEEQKAQVRQLSSDIEKSKAPTNNSSGR